MDNPSRQPNNFEAPPPDSQRVMIDDYRGPMNGPAVPPANLSISANEEETESASAMSQQDSEGVYTAFRLLAWLGGLCSLGSVGGLGGTLTTVLTRPAGVPYKWSDAFSQPVGILAFVLALIGLLICLAVILRFRHRRLLHRTPPIAWIGSIAGIVTVIVSLLTYAGVVDFY